MLTHEQRTWLKARVDERVRERQGIDEHGKPMPRCGYCDRRFRPRRQGQLFCQRRCQAVAAVHAHRARGGRW